VVTDVVLALCYCCDAFVIGCVHDAFCSFVCFRTFVVVVALPLLLLLLVRLPARANVCCCALRLRCVAVLLFC